MNELEKIILISGKRKSGKDFISEKLNAILREKSTIIRISEPIKYHYAKAKGLNFKELMSDSKYKENFRKEMIDWSDGIRSKDPGYFCKAASDQAPLKSIWIISDIRRKTDIEWFKKTFGDKIKTVRVLCDEEVRKKRGWIFTEGVDNVTSECNLDDYEEWDLIVENNDEQSFLICIERLIDLLEEK